MQFAVAALAPRLAAKSRTNPRRHKPTTPSASTRPKQADCGSRGDFVPLCTDAAPQFRRLLKTEDRTGHTLAPAGAYTVALQLMARRNRKRRARSGGPTPPTRPAAKSAHAGARVARVAVDDETWAAFRELCGPAPASVRLGDLVRAEVARARAARDPAADALRSLQVIRDQMQALENHIRGHAGEH